MLKYEAPTDNNAQIFYNLRGNYFSRTATTRGNSRYSRMQLIQLLPEEDEVTQILAILIRGIADIKTVGTKIIFVVMDIAEVVYFPGQINSFRARVSKSEV